MRKRQYAVTNISCSSLFFTHKKPNWGSKFLTAHLSFVSGKSTYILQASQPIPFNRIRLFLCYSFSPFIRGSFEDALSQRLSGMPEMRPNTTPSDESSALNNALVESVALPLWYRARKAIYEPTNLIFEIADKGKKDQSFLWNVGFSFGFWSWKVLPFCTFLGGRVIISA